jgi:hypothetical protein
MELVQIQAFSDYSTFSQGITVVDTASTPRVI